MIDTSIAAEFEIIAKRTDPDPVSNPVPQLPWEADPLFWQKCSTKPASNQMVKRIEAEALFGKIFDGFQVEAEPKLQKQKSVSEAVRDIVQDTIGEMDIDDLMQKIAAGPTAPSPADLQKRKRDFVAEMAEKRTNRLSEIICTFAQNLEGKGINTDRLNFAPLQRSMNALLEGVLMAA
jgi:hypothetical protein